MSKTTVLTTRVSAELSARIDELAKETERSRAWVIAKALERYVDDELEFIGAIREGERDIAEGRFVSHDELVAEIRAMRQQKDAA
jgi:predicted transcriptional regulator